jgi:hypothetical protein
MNVTASQRNHERPSRDDDHRRPDDRGDERPQDPERGEDEPADEQHREHGAREVASEILFHGLPGDESPNGTRRRRGVPQRPTRAAGAL